MSYLSELALINGDEKILASALLLTDEIRLLLLEYGIQPEGVNKLCIPAGYSNVGTFTILCHLPPHVELSSIDPDPSEVASHSLWAKAGTIKWLLSKNYRIHRLFPNTPDDGTTPNTLSVISFDDWRYDLNLDAYGSTMPKGANTYKSDYSLYPFNDTIVEDSTEQEEGIEPYAFASLDDEDEKLHIEIVGDGDPEILSLLDREACWGYETRISTAAFTDRVLTACGCVAVPTPITHGSSDDWDTNEPPWANWGSKKYMRVEYIGNGYINAQLSAEEYGHFYRSGQLECSFGDVENDQEMDAEDYMHHFLGEIPEEPSDAYTWIADPKDGTQEIPLTVNVQFPAKMTNGTIVLYIIKGVFHGFPSGNGSNHGATEVVTLTDTVKTRCTDNFDGIEFPEEGILTIEIEKGEYEEVPGLSPDRARVLANRAMYLSRTYYSRYYACTGVWELQGFRQLNAWSGQLMLEYGYRNGMPYTRASGEKDNQLYGFTQTDLLKNTVLADGNVLLARPDGLAEIATVRFGEPLLAEIDKVHTSPDGCFYYYDVKMMHSGIIYEFVMPTDRIITNMCYEPVGVGTRCLFAFKPFTDDPTEEPGCGDACNYLFILGEEIQTTVCQ